MDPVSERRAVELQGDRTKGVSVADGVLDTSNGVSSVLPMQPPTKAVAPAISPTREKDFPGWFQSIIREADLAENSQVRGCMVLKPNG